MNILLIGGGLQGMSCGESLRQEGHEVDMVSSGLQVRHSCFWRKIYESEPEIKIDGLSNILKNETFDVIVPMGDADVSLLSKNKAFIEQTFGVKCASPDYEKLSIVEDKHRFMAFCAENDVPHPKTAVLGKDNLETIANEVGFPSLIKPDFSVGARGITRVDSIEELKGKYTEIFEKYGSCTLQELIENEEYYYNVMLYRSKEGKYLGNAISKIVRMYPVHAGSSSCLVTVENEELLKICKNCLDKLEWVGMADFDVLQRLDNKEYKIIEINARVPASLRAAQISGVNFPEIIVRDTLNKEVPTYFYQPGKTLRYMGIDIMWLLKSSKRFKTKPSWLHFLGRNVYYQDIIKKDPSTWWTWLAEGISKITRRNKRLR